VDANTVKGWESGRRPLGNTKAATLRALTHHLRLLGVDDRYLVQLDTAVDVDLVVGQVLADDHRCDPRDHPLATWVTTRHWHDLLAPALSGPQPLLSRADREIFCANLRSAAERTLTLGAQDTGAVLLRRQAVYMLAAWDQSADAPQWLAEIEGRPNGGLRRNDGWTPAWVAQRSLAVARSVGGDRDYLRHFIRTQLCASDELESANLNYWAYWIGEGERSPAISDSFMASDLGPWRGLLLLRHLSDGLTPTTPYLELSIHSLWTLLARRPHLLGEDDHLTQDLGSRAAVLLDETTEADLSEQTRRELDQLHYATHMARGPR
jgi:hypothetical protein